MRPLFCPSSGFGVAPYFCMEAIAGASTFTHINFKINFLNLIKIQIKKSNDFKSF